jgi:hypothetical protein
MPRPSTPGGDPNFAFFLRVPDSVELPSGGVVLQEVLRKLEERQASAGANT